jgi:hypothetical protein
MEQQLQQIAVWLHASFSLAALDARTLMSFGFVGFNTFRVLLHIPQLLTCLRCTRGCPTINVWTWASLAAASLSTALYMGLCLGELLGAALNAANAAMCAATVGITWIKRRGGAGAPALLVSRRG